MVSISLKDDYLEKIDTYIENGKYPDRSTFVNNAVNYLFLHHETNYIIELMYWVAIPVFLFLFTIYMALMFKSFILYGISGVSGIYLMVFMFMFHKKYKGIKR